MLVRWMSYSYETKLRFFAMLSSIFGRSKFQKTRRIPSKTPEAPVEALKPTSKRMGFLTVLMIDHILIHILICLCVLVVGKQNLVKALCTAKVD